MTWFIGDLIAGLTVGMVLVPQSMSYAVIATLPAEYGLYSRLASQISPLLLCSVTHVIAFSFVGVTIYCVSSLSP